MTEASETIPHLKDLSDFRFQVRSFLSFSETVSESCGVAAQQYQLLQVIGAAPAGQASSISYLAERMILRHNSTVELVDRAERAGLVVRRSDEHDLRRSLIEITPHGWTILRRLVAEHMEKLAAQGHEIVAAIEKLLAAKHRYENQEMVGQK